MNRVKLQFSEEETVLVSDPAIILTKNRVLGKVSEMFGALSEIQRERAESDRHRLPPEFFEMAPKISRGDNYQGLPWLMLDFPRCFRSDNMLAVRQFFWWGKFFSSALLVSGPLQQEILERLGAGFAKQAGVGMQQKTECDFPEKPTSCPQWNHLYICVHASPWEHHLQEDNFKLIGDISIDELAALGQREFLKLAFMAPVRDWAMAPDFFNQSFTRWMQLLVRD